MAPRTKAQPGDRYGRLTIIERVQGNYNTRWRCRCDCGGETLVYQPNLSSGRVASCGCLLKEYNDGRKKTRVYVNGYAFILMPKHPRASKTSGRVREHIVVMEAAIGRHLLPGEEVHHLNGVRDDNRLENLELWTRSQPSGARVIDKISWAKEILRTYEPGSLK